MSIQYHQVFPENTLTSYSGDAQTQIDFLLTYEGKALEMNSLRLNFDLDITPSSGADDFKNVRADPDLFYDPAAGLHGVISSCVTSVNGAVIENLNSYARMVAMETQSTLTTDELNVASQSCEGKVANQRLTNLFMRGVVAGEFTDNDDGTTANYLTALVEKPSASIKPRICLNKCFTEDGSMPLLSFSRSGVIRVSFRLARSSAFLYGSSSEGSSYALSNVRLTYVSRDDSPNLAPILSRGVTNVKQAITSNSANIQAIIPGSARAVSVSFQPQANENTAFHNNLQLYKIPSLTQVQYLFNDSTNQYITFIIKSEIESLERYLESFTDTGSNSASLQAIKSNNAYGLGTSLGQYVNLANSKFSIQIQSAIGTATNGATPPVTVPMLAYIYFHTLLRL